MKIYSGSAINKLIDERNTEVLRLERKIERLEARLLRIQEIIADFPMLILVRDREVCEEWLKQFEEVLRKEAETE